MIREKVYVIRFWHDTILYIIVRLLSVVFCLLFYVCIFVAGFDLAFRFVFLFVVFVNIRLLSFVFVVVFVSVPGIGLSLSSSSSLLMSLSLSVVYILGLGSLVYHSLDTPLAINLSLCLSRVLTSHLLMNAQISDKCSRKERRKRGGIDRKRKRGGIVCVERRNKKWQASSSPSKTFPKKKEGTFTITYIPSSSTWQVMIRCFNMYRNNHIQSKFIAQPIKNYRPNP